MSESQIVTDADGSVQFLRWPKRFALLLDLLVVFADPDYEEPGTSVGADTVRARLFPSPFGGTAGGSPPVPGGEDAARLAEWERNVRPELRALFDSARAIVACDLAAAKRGSRGGIVRLLIPAPHRAAWVSALQIARLAIAERHKIDAGAMRAPPSEVTEELRAPIVLIDFYAMIQGALL